MSKETKETVKQGVSPSTIVLGISMAAILALGITYTVNSQDDDAAPAADSSQTQAAEDNQAAQAPATNTIVDVAVNNGFDTLVAAVQAADLVETLSGGGPFTVFAPTDEAFAALPAGTLDSLLEPANKQQLADILTYHVVAGDIRAAGVVELSGQNVTTVNGDEWHVLVEGGKVFILNPQTAEKIAEVVQTDVIADNGVVHVIDRVLVPGS